MQIVRLISRDKELGELEKFDGWDKNVDIVNSKMILGLSVSFKCRFSWRFESIICHVVARTLQLYKVKSENSVKVWTLYLVVILLAWSWLFCFNFEVWQLLHLSQYFSFLDNENKNCATVTGRTYCKMLQIKLQMTKLWPMMTNEPEKSLVCVFLMECI